MQLTERRKQLVYAVTAGILAAISSLLYLAKEKRNLIFLSEPIAVIIAMKDIPEDSILDESLIREEFIPRQFIQPGSFMKLSDAIGRVAIVPIKKGEMVTDTKARIFDKISGLSGKVPFGKRAISISVDEVSGVNDFIKPDNLVDILATFDFGSDAMARVYTYTILEGVRVLAVGNKILFGNEQKSKNSEKSTLGAELQSKKQTITLALDPVDVQKVVLAQESGTITISLRSKWEDVKPMSLEPATPASITGMRELIRERSRPIYREYRGR